MLASIFKRAVLARAVRHTPNHTASMIRAATVTSLPTGSTSDDDKFLADRALTRSDLEANPQLIAGFSSDSIWHNLITRNDKYYQDHAEALLLICYAKFEHFKVISHEYIDKAEILDLVLEGMIGYESILEYGTPSSKEYKEAIFRLKDMAAYLQSEAEPQFKDMTKKILETLSKYENPTEPSPSLR